MLSGGVAWIHADLARWWKAALARDSERPPWNRSGSRPLTGAETHGATGGAP